jgi:hypothetical protein
LRAKTQCVISITIVTSITSIISVVNTLHKIMLCCISNWKERKTGFDESLSCDRQMKWRGNLFLKPPSVHKERVRASLFHDNTVHSTRRLQYVLEISPNNKLQKFCPLWEGKDCLFLSSYFSKTKQKVIFYLFQKFPIKRYYLLKIRFCLNWDFSRS